MTLLKERLLEAQERKENDIKTLHGYIRKIEIMEMFRMRLN